MALERYRAAANLFCRLALANARPHPRRSLEERLAMLPLKAAPVSRPVTIFWDDHQVPFIEAQSDEDLAAALGAVHAHLRLGQMELMRRLAQGRVSEMVGRFGLGLDRLIRTFDIGRAVPRILATMPAETRIWLESFARGINHCLDHATERPREFALLDLKREPWTIGDLVMLGRLIAADVNWIVWLRLLKFRAKPDWPQLWQRLLQHDMLSYQSDNSAGAISDAAQALTGGALRSGSNSLAVAAARSESGGALIASDPHLSITLPNLWLLAGVKSPSHHAVGLMVPGIPFIAIGRNPWVAWGGASLHAASSDLLEVPSGTALGERIETISVRGEADLILRVAESPWGPVVSDLPAFGSGNAKLAMRWMGHEPSDEFTAMLRAGRARNWDEFRNAFYGYALPGLEMIFADACGHIGQLMAAKLPHRKNSKPPDIVSNTENDWDSPIQSAELPARFDPPEGFVASANARPKNRAPIVGFHFSPRDRMTRLEHLLSKDSALSVPGLMRIQRDVHLAAALAKRDILMEWLRAAPLESIRTRRLCDALKNWDGNYDAQSPGANAFELLFFHLARELVPAPRRSAYEAAWGTRALTWDDIMAAPKGTRLPALGRAARKAARDFKRAVPWGERHRLRLTHPFGLIPITGRSYRFADLPVAGTSESLMKTAHGLTNRRHHASYGSVARHISDLSDPDRNYFALLGGQDGSFGSANFIDQLGLWQRGEYIALPLRVSSVARSFRHRTVLLPGQSP
ncbi:MAG TPA: penicillin acylase family protein [Micropepsaceae bacterium]|nr:penicillin acylase family protein [Micropepsaceae bacterium]